MSLIVLGHVEIASGNQGTARDLLGQAALLCVSIGNEIYLPWCLEGIAAIAVASGDHAMAANLEGGRDAIAQRTGTSIHALHRSAHETTIQTARSASGENRFEATRRAGRARPPHVIIDAALAAARHADTEHHAQRVPETGQRTTGRATWNSHPHQGGEECGSRCSCQVGGTRECCAARSPDMLALDVLVAPRVSWSSSLSGSAAMTAFSSSRCNRSARRCRSARLKPARRSSRSPASTARKDFTS